MPFTNINTPTPITSGTQNPPVQAATLPSAQPQSNAVVQESVSIPKVSNESLEVGINNEGIKGYKPKMPESEPFVQVQKVDVSSNFENKLSNLNTLVNQVAQQQVENLNPLKNNVEPLPVNSVLKNYDLYELLKYSISQKASDIHLTSGYRPMVRVDGSLQVISAPILFPEQINHFVKDLIKNRVDLNTNTIHEADLTYTVDNRRFRVNIFKQMGNFAITARIIPDRIFTADELGLPPVVKNFSRYPNGLVLVTGPTGSGKSTTIASILNMINLTLPKHIVTLEDPVEYVFPKGIGLVDQREFGIDFTSWDNALRAVLRQDPDVVLVGEMRDLETVEAALQIAETGHLVFATLHTNSAAESINRVIDIFESAKQDQIRVQLASVLRAVVSQKLVPLSTGGRKVATEVLITTSGVKNAIRDKKTFQIDNIIQTSLDIGMISLEHSLVKMVREGVLSKEVAKSLSLNPNQIEILLQQ